MNSRAQGGFTLVELLVAISLFALIMVLIFAGFRFADKGWQHSVQQVNETEKIRLLHQVLQQYLRSAQPVWREQLSNKTLMFAGTEKQLEFVASMPAHLGPAGLYELQLNLQPQLGQRQVLQLSRRLLHTEDQVTVNDELNKTSDLFEGLDDISFAYFGITQDGDIAAWSDSWIDQVQMPMLVRLRLRWAESETEFLIQLLTMASELSPVARSDSPAAVMGFQ